MLTNIFQTLLLVLTLYLTIQISRILLQALQSEFKKISTALLAISIFSISFQILNIQFLSFFKAISIYHISAVTLLFWLFLKIFKKQSLQLPKTNFRFSKLFIFLPLFIIYGIRFLNSLLQIPLEYDSNAYHLPFVAEWLQTQTLSQSYYSAYAGPIGYYPSNYELIDLFFTSFVHHDFFVNLLNFPILILLGLSFYALLKHFKVSTNLSLFSTALLLSQPIFARQLGLPLVDLFFSFTFVTAILFLLKSKSQHPKAPLIISGLALGLFIGTKFLGLIYGVIIFALAVVLLKNFKKILTISIPAFLTGSFFYLRNLFETGNPIFPVHLQIGDWTILQGYQSLPSNLTDTTLLSNLTNLPNLKVFLTNFYQMVGPSSLLLLLTTAGLISYLIYHFLKSQTKTQFLNQNQNLIYLLISIPVFALLYFKAPYTWRDLTPNIRYAMMFLLLGTLTIPIFISKLIPTKFQKASLPIIYVITLYNLYLIVFPADYILYNDKLALDFTTLYKYFDLYSIIALLSTISIYTLHKLPAHRTKTLLITTFLFLQFIPTFQAYADQEAKYFYTKWYSEAPKQLHLMQAMDWLTSNHSPSSVSYSGFNFHYPLYGRNIQNQVQYTNINSCTNCRYHDFKNTEGSIRSNPDYQAWTSNLIQNQTQYLIVAPAYTEGVQSYEQEWATQNQESFQEIYSQNQIHIYRFTPSP